MIMQQAYAQANEVVMIATKQAQEILDNAWLTAPADQNILFRTPIADRWREAAKLIGIDIVTMPGVAGHA